MFGDNFSIHVTRPTNVRTYNVFLTYAIFHQRVSVADVNIIRVTYLLTYSMEKSPS